MIEYDVSCELIYVGRAISIDISFIESGMCIRRMNKFESQTLLKRQIILRKNSITCT